MLSSEDRKKLEQEFENELLWKVQESKKKCKYNPTRFIQMISEHGAVDTAHILIRQAIENEIPATGLTTLWEVRRLDLSMEESVCNPKYKDLFSPEEIADCEQQLKKLGWQRKSL